MKKILIAVVIGLVAYFLGTLGFNSKESTLIALIAFLVALWTNEGLPLGVVSLLPLILFPAFDILTTNQTASNYSKSIIFLFLGGFMLAIAVEKTGLHKQIANKMLSFFPSTVRGMIFSLSMTSGILSSFLSNTTTTLLLMPLALFLSDDVKIKMRFALAIAYGASVGGIITPIGTPPNLIFMGILESNSMQQIAFIKWVGLVFPLALLMFLVVGFVLSFGTQSMMLQRDDKIQPLTNNQKKVLFTLVGLIVLLFVNSWLGLNEKGILLFFGLLMFMPLFNILKWEDSKKIPYEIIFLFGAGFSIAKAFSETGLANSVANYLLTFMDLSPILVLLLIATLVTFTTEVTSNTALISMMLPIIYAVSQKAGLDSTLFMMAATICASYAFMLPIATPPNAIAMSSKAIKVKDMATFGLIFNISGIIIITIIAHFVWSKFL